MILYFSGTGNSRFAALRLAGALHDEAVSLTPLLREGRSEHWTSQKPYVLVCPTYAWRVPRVVEDLLRACTLDGDRRMYVVLTCGTNAGNAGRYASALCRRLGLTYCGLAAVVMPENYLALFPTPAPDRAAAIVRGALPALDALVLRIAAGQPFPERRPTLLDRVESGPVNSLFYPLFVGDKRFRVTSACVGCGLCASRCPLDNISLRDGRPVWRGRCTHCMACIAGCPARAIEYGRATVGRHRHTLS